MKDDLFQPMFDLGITDPVVIREVINIALAAVHDRVVHDQLMDLSMLNEDALTRALQQKIGGR